MNHKYVVITPARNEAKFIGSTIESMTAQTILPRHWIIVDDGSTDDTGDIVEAASRLHPWITLIRLQDRGFRKSGGGVVEAFYEGYWALRDTTWDFIVKLDADLSFSSEYFQACFARFEMNPSLGIGGGTVCVVDDAGREKVDSPDDPPFHVRGATKIYSRACWEQISPLVSAPGWDTIDEVRANMKGWSTRTFADVTLVQHRGTGSIDGVWRDGYKNGLGAYITGYHPLFMFAKCIKRAFKAPPLAAAALCAGFCSGYLKRVPMVDDPDAIRYLRQHQLSRLMLRRNIYSHEAQTGNAAGHSSSN